MKNFDNFIFTSPKFNEKISAWEEHIPFAFFLIKSLKPGTFVELGTHFGNSYFSFCQAIGELKLDTKAFSVDLWQGDEHAGYYGEEVLDYVRKVNEQHFNGFSRLMKMSFDEANGHFEDGSIDLLHIDGLHTYEAVRHDFDNWLPKLSKRGVVILHDTSEFQEGFGVWKLLEELQQRYAGFNFRHGHGLGVICVGPEVNSDFLEFVRESGADSFNLALFSMLGRNISLIRQNDQMIQESGPVRAELVETREKLRIATNALTMVTGSWSWRITRPLRWFSGLLRKTE